MIQIRVNESRAIKSKQQNDSPNTKLQHSTYVKQVSSYVRRCQLSSLTGFMALHSHNKFQNSFLTQRCHVLFPFISLVYSFIIITIIIV
jgi:hypothetical protein